MNGTFNDNMASGYAKMTAFAGISGTYTRGSASTIIAMTPTQAEWQAVIDTGIVSSAEQITWICSAVEWAKTGLTVPQRNDSWSVTLADGVSYAFLILPPKGVQEYEINPHGDALHIHMKRVAT
jgi:hypothetical protein